METILASMTAPLVEGMATLLLAVLTWGIQRMVRQANRRWKLDIDLREQAQLEGLAADAVHFVEATVTGKGRGGEKLTTAVGELQAKAVVAGIDITGDVARRKIEKALHETGIKVAPAHEKLERLRCDLLRPVEGRGRAEGGESL